LLKVASITESAKDFITCARFWYSKAIDLPSMKKYRNLLFYILTITASALLIWLTIERGYLIQSGKHIAPAGSGAAATGAHSLTAIIRENIDAPLAILLLQIVTILVVGRFMGYLFRKIKQPAVIGEMAAGILMGASFLGYYFPEVSQFIFPKKSIPNLNLLSQTGLVLFMFIIGLELDLKMLKGKTNTAILISHASIVAPFTMGVALAYFTYEQYAPEGILFLPYALFVGISMSITAFPVLARIIQERGLSRTKLGTIAITCAAADDITAWCILALVIAIAKAGTAMSAVYTIVSSVVYVIIMLKVVKPWLQKLWQRQKGNTALQKPFLAICLIILIASSYLTDIIGIHALFGAFMAGIIMPQHMPFREQFIEKVESVALLLLLPLFFVSTGLKTQIGLLNSPALWSLCIVIILIAVVGKLGVSALAARFTGQSWKDSLQIGALMNTRGLTELVVLNIGYDLGVITPEIFTILVIMALTTTFMTGPLLDIINYFSRKNALK
jgi:Kef-type K+ transport system membrane component KefB